MRLRDSTLESLSSKRRHSESKLARAPEQSESTHRAYLVAAEHLLNSTLEEVLRERCVYSTGVNPSGAANGPVSGPAIETASGRARPTSDPRTRLTLVSQLTLCGSPF